MAWNLQLTSQQAPTIHTSLYLHGTGMVSVRHDTQIEVSGPCAYKASPFLTVLVTFVDLPQTRVTWEAIPSAKDLSALGWPMGVPVRSVFSINDC